MYNITELLSGNWHCAVGIQDGTERWTENSRTEAVQSVIAAARVLNGSYINQDDISFHRQQQLQDQRVVSEDDWNLLQEIRRGAKIVLDHTDPRIRYRLTPEDCETIIKIREGEISIR